MRSEEESRRLIESLSPADVVWFDEVYVLVGQDENGDYVYEPAEDEDGRDRIK